MKIEVDISEGTGWTIFGTVLVLGILTCIALCEWRERIKIESETSVQIELAKQGYSPVEISCAYNIEAPVCLAKEMRVQ